MPLSTESPDAWSKCLAVVRPVLLLAPTNFLSDISDRLAADGIQAAVDRHDTPVLFDWIVRLLARQGISNTAAESFIETHGSPHWLDVARTMSVAARCPRLRSHWHFADCGFRRSSQTCNTPHHQLGCPVPALPARKGSLAVATVGLWLFIRDVCDGDLVAWIDARLTAADTGVSGVERAALMRASLLEPLIEITGTGPKIWNMILAELLLGGDPDRERWVISGV